MRENWMDITVGKLKLHTKEATTSLSEKDIKEMKDYMMDWDRLGKAIEIAKKERPDLAEHFDVFGLLIWDQYLQPETTGSLGSLNDPITTSELITAIEEYNDPEDPYISIEDYLNTEPAEVIVDW